MADAIDITIGAKDLTKAAFASVSTSIKALTGGLGTVTNAAMGMVNMLGRIGLAANGIEAIGRSFAGMAQGLLSGNAALEMTTISFKTLLGSASAANAMIKQLTAFAAATPFELSGLESATQRLLAFGFNAKDIIPIMTSLGDAISALGGTQDNLNSLVYVMGQMRAESHLNAGDLMQLTNLGIPALQMLADHYKVTTGEMQNMVSKGLVPGAEAVQIFTKSLEERYGGMMKAQSATFSGMISNLQDWAKATTIILTKPLFEPAKRALAAFLDYVQSPAGVAAINKLAGYIQIGVDRMVASFDRLAPKIKPFLSNLQSTSKLLISQYTYVAQHIVPTLNALINSFSGLALAILKVRYAFSPLGVVFATLNGFLKGGIDGAVKAFQSRLNDMQVYVGNALLLIRTTLEKYGPDILNWLGTFGSQIAQKAIEWGKALLGWVTPLLPKLLARLEDLAEKVISWIINKAPVFLDKLESWATSFLDWVVPLAGRLVQKLLSLLTVVLNWITAHADVILDKLETWADSFLDWILPMVPKIITNLLGLLNKVISWLVNNAPKILTALLTWAEQFVDWISPMIGQVLLNLRDLIDVLLRWISQNAPKIVNRLLNWALAFLRWIDPLIPLLVNALSRIISSVLDWIIKNAPEILRMALSWGESILKAIMAITPQLLTALGVIVQTILGWFVQHGPELLNAFWGWISQSIDIISNIFEQISPVLFQLIGLMGNWIANHAQEILSKLWGFLSFGLNLATKLMVYIAPVLFDIVNQIGQWIAAHASEILDKFWSFFKTAINVGTTLLPLIEPTLRDIISAIGGWVSKNAPDILNTFWSFFRTAINVGTDLLPLIEPTLKDIVTAIGGWVATNSHDILNTFWSFFKGAFNVATDLMPLIEPVLSDIVVGIGSWVTQHASDILDTFWSFFVQGVNLIENVMTKLEPVLEALIDRMGNWIVSHADEITTEFFKFLTWAADNAEKLIVKLTPAIIKIIGAMGDAFSAHADTIIDGLAASLLKSVQENPDEWAAVGRFMIAAMLGPWGIAGDIALEYLRSKSSAGQRGGNFTDPTANDVQKMLDKLPKKARGDSSFRGGPVLWGEAGWERFSMPGGASMYSAGPVYMDNAPAGSKITPMGDMGGGGGHTININLTVNGNPTAAQKAEMKRIAKDAVKEGLTEAKGKSVNLRTVSRAVR